MPRKSYPSSKAISGMYFPSSASSGNCIPFQASILGRTFPLDPQPETASHFERKFRDAFFESLPIRKARPTLDASGHGTIDLSGLPSIKRRPPGRRGTKFIASSARKGGHLMWASSCAGPWSTGHRGPPPRRTLLPASSPPTHPHIFVLFLLRAFFSLHMPCPDAREDVSFRKMDRPPSAMGATPPARPFWRLQPCYPDLPWWDGPSRQPSCRAAT